MQHFTSTNKRFEELDRTYPRKFEISCASMVILTDKFRMQGNVYNFENFCEDAIPRGLKKLIRHC